MSAPHPDVVVVGCGIIGAAVAWELSRAGRSVRVLDPDAGDGATFAAAGMLAPVSEAHFGERDLLRLNLASAARWPDFAATLTEETGLPTGYETCGALGVAFDQGDRLQHERLLALHREWGLEVTALSPAEAREREPLLGPRIAGGTWIPGDHHVNPRLVQAALLRALHQRGVDVHPTRAVSLVRTGDRVSGVVDALGTTHTAGTVALCAGWQSRELVREVPDVDVPTRPVKGQVIRLGPPPAGAPVLRQVIRGLVQTRPVYLVPRPTAAELVIGATSEEQPDDRQITAGGIFTLLRDARALVPGIDEWPVAEVTARARPGSPDNAPLIGATGVPGLLMATGHHRGGVLLAPLTAAAIGRLHDAPDARPDARPGHPDDDALRAADPRRFAPTRTGGQV